MQRKRFITNHAEERLYERLGLTNSVDLVHDVKKYGLTRKMLTGNIRKYVDNRWREYGMKGQYFVYLNHLWIFNGRSLITVYAIPEEKQC